MTAVRAIAAAVVLLAAPAAAQVPLPPAGASALDLNRYQADQHRYEMDRLRARADQRESFARQPDPVQPPAYRALRTPEEERAAREAATRRREATAAGVSQIDAWLDRPRR